MSNLTHEEIAWLRSLDASELRGYLADLDPADAAALQAELDGGTTRHDVAEFFGISIDTVELWKRKGCPCISANGSPTRFDLREVARWITKQRYGKLEDNKDSQADIEYREERRKLLEVQRKKAEGSLVEMDRIRTVVFAVVQDISVRMASLPRQVDQHAIETVNEAIVTAREKFESEFDRI